MIQPTTRILVVTASARQRDSITRQMAQDWLREFTRDKPGVEVRRRDVSIGLPFIDHAWVEANFTPAVQRNQDQQQVLSESDRLVDELVWADVIVIAAPIYNFSIPASLKAWIDLVARVGRTFNYTLDGPVGRLRGKQSYLLLASGGMEIGSDADFASGYLQHILNFIGINEVTLLVANRRRQESRLDRPSSHSTRTAQAAQTA